eukprot:g4520.t1
MINGEKRGRYPFSQAWWSAHGWQKHLQGTPPAALLDLGIVTQNDAFERKGKEIQDQLLDGNAVVLFAYGLSGSGKTFSIFGPDGMDDPSAWFKHETPHPMWGIFPRIAYNVCNERTSGASHARWKVSIKFFQNVVDEVRDLLSPLTPATEHHFKTGMHLDEHGFLDVTWCTQRVVKTWAEMRKILEAANARKALAPTQFNHCSTRGHCILVLEVDMPLSDTMEKKKRGRLYVCDLAGAEPAGDIVYAQYERVQAVGNAESMHNVQGEVEGREGEGEEEGVAEWIYKGKHKDEQKTKALQEQGKMINLSLSELSQFFLKMASGIKKKRLRPGQSIPGCNNFFLGKFLKKTMLQAHTYLFAAIRPELQYASYTHSTLTFAHNASIVKLAPKRPVAYVSGKEKAMYEELLAMKKKIENLEKENEELGAEAARKEMQDKLEQLDAHYDSGAGQAHAQELQKASSDIQKLQDTIAHHKAALAGATTALLTNDEKKRVLDEVDKLHAISPASREAAHAVLADSTTHLEASQILRSVALGMDPDGIKSAAIEAKSSTITVTEKDIAAFRDFVRQSSVDLSTIAAVEIALETCTTRYQLDAIAEALDAGKSPEDISSAAEDVAGMMAERHTEDMEELAMALDTARENFNEALKANMDASREASKWRRMSLSAVAKVGIMQSQHDSDVSRLHDAETRLDEEIEIQSKLEESIAELKSQHERDVEHLRMHKDRQTEARNATKERVKALVADLQSTHFVLHDLRHAAESIINERAAFIDSARQESSVLKIQMSSVENSAGQREERLAKLLTESRGQERDLKMKLIKSEQEVQDKESAMERQALAHEKIAACLSSTEEALAECQEKFRASASKERDVQQELAESHMLNERLEVSLETLRGQLSDADKTTAELNETLRNAQKRLHEVEIRLEASQASLAAQEKESQSTIEKLRADAEVQQEMSMVQKSRELEQTLAQSAAAMESAQRKAAGELASAEAKFAAQLTAKEEEANVQRLD